MIRKLFGLVPDEFASLRPRLLAAIVAQGLGEAVAYLLLVPTLEALLDDDLGAATRWALVMLAVVVVVAALKYAQSVAAMRMAVRLQRHLQTRIGDYLNSVPLGWFETHSAGPLSRTAVESVRVIQGAIAHLLNAMITGIVVPLAVAVGMLFIDWRVSLAMLVAAPLLFGVSAVAGRAYAKAEVRVHDAAAEADSRVIEFAQAQPVLRAFGSSDDGNRELDIALRRQRAANLGTIASSVPGLVAFGLCLQAVLLLLVYVVVSRVTGGVISAGTGVALIAVSTRFIDPLAQTALLGNGIRGATAAIDRVTALFDVTPLAEPAAAQALAEPSVAFEKVTFGYQEGEPVLSDVSFTVPAGTTTAIVGPSGGGKTTLLRLAARFHDVESGRVLVGGVDVAAQLSATLLDQLSLVFQNVYLFDRSVLENIRIGRPDATDAQVRAAASAAQVDEITDRLPDGYDTRVGEGGSLLSGGERQRVSIARALLKNAPVVLLDEVTSALDPHSEALVVRGVHEVTKGKTVIVVAHRLATIAHADQILFLDGGRIVERGTHGELLALGGRYADFWAERSRASGWRLDRATH